MVTIRFARFGTKKRPYYHFVVTDRESKRDGDFLEQIGTYDPTKPVSEVKIEMAVSEPFVEPTIEAILSSARTGAVGDGKIFVQELERVVRIRTGERDTSALTPITADDVQRRANEEALNQDALDDAALDALEALG